MCQEIRIILYHICFLFLFTSSYELNAQSSTLILHITSNTDNRPIAGAEVTVLESDINDLSDENGRVEFNTIPEGAHVVGISREGYQGETMILNIKSRDIVEANVLLTAQLDEVIVTAKRIDLRLEELGFYERKEKGFGTFITSDEIEKKGKLKMTEAIRGITGVQVKRLLEFKWEGVKLVAVSGRSVTGSGGAIMSSTPCPLELFLDGSHLGDEIPNLDQLVTLGDVAAIEVYKGPAGLPSRFSQFNSCGAIVIWTKTGNQE